MTVGIGIYNILAGIYYDIQPHVGYKIMRQVRYRTVPCTCTFHPLEKWGTVTKMRKVAGGFFRVKGSGHPF